MSTDAHITAPAVPSYASGTSDVPLLGDTIGDNLDRTVAAHGDRDALVDRASARRWSYRELADDEAAVALGLLGLGVEKGDRVGIWVPNRPEWTIVQYATAKIGAILVNINPAYRVHELEYVLGQAGIRTIVAAPSFKTSDYAAMIAEVRPRCSAVRDVILLGSPEWTSLVDSGRAADPARLVEIAGTLSTDDPINIQYTSGTTGFPKGAVLSHHNILNNGFSVGELCNYTEQDRICIPVPFYHCFGMVIPSAAFEPKAALGAVADVSGARRCTACRRCSSPSLPMPTSTPTTCPACAPGSWPARRARSR